VLGELGSVSHRTTREAAVDRNADVMIRLARSAPR
jgi:hypothetical protein